MIRSCHLALFAAACFALAGCHDTRRDAVRDYLQTHPPDGFEVVAVPEEFAISDTGSNTSKTEVAMRYRLAQPTIETHDLLSLPRAAALVKRLDEIRGWAIASLPADHPLRGSITSGAAAALTPFPTKRVVTPKGAEIAASVPVSLHKGAKGWSVDPEPITVTAPGAADQDPRIPFEDAPEVATKLGELGLITTQLEGLREKYLADRQRAVEQSVANMRSVLKTGDIFEGHLPDQTPVRVVISKGAEGGNSVVAVLSLQRPALSSARYSGGLVLLPSGTAIWRAAQVTSLSSPDGDPLTDGRRHPVLTAAATDKSLNVQIKTGVESLISFKLSPAGSADLIPDTSSQTPGNE